MDVNLPPDLDRWLKSRADQIGVEPELLLHQLVDSYRTSGSEEESGQDPSDPFGGDLGRDRFSPDRSRAMDAAVVESLLEKKLDEWVAEDLESVIDGRVTETVEAELETAIESQLADAVEAELEETLDERVDDAIDAAVDAAIERRVGPRIDEVVEAETTALENRLEERIDALEADRTEVLEDVRDRVIQVKKEADTKAPKAAHEETRATLERLEAELEDLEEQLVTLSETVTNLTAETDRIDDHAATLEALETGVEETEDRINTLAWNVNEIRDFVDTATDLEPVLEKAAQLDVDRAKCDHCDAAVDIGLLTEPECPHCASRLTGVVDSRSFFGKPRLLVSDDAEQ